jgi:hypothetical protein
MKQSLNASVWKWCVSALFLLPVHSFAQHTEQTSHFEIGITAGPSNFLGDLGGTMGKGRPFLKDNNFPMTKLTIGAFISYHPNEWIAARFAINKGNLEGDDAIINGKGGYEEYRKIRNSNFRSKFTEAFLIGELYPTIFTEYDPSDLFHKFRPYGVLGVGVFKYNPQGTDPLTGNWVDLKPLHTEGQGFPEYGDRPEYKLTQLNIPMGFGVKYYLSEKVNLSFEIIHRKTFTDYIDDVSKDYIDPALFYQHLPLAQAQLAERMANKTGNSTTRVFNAGDKRGTPKNMDAYYTAGFKLGFRLGSSNDRSMRSMGCPVRF